MWNSAEGMAIGVQMAEIETAVISLQKESPGYLNPSFFLLH
jgi:hypothetical protein